MISEVMKSCLFLICILYSFYSYANYPDSWWEKVNDPNKPSWEILPHEADKTKNEVIISKRNELGILSNFAATPFMLKGKKYASLEGLWQSMKFPESEKDERAKLSKSWPFKRSEVEQMVAFEAMHAGKKASQIMKDIKVSWITFMGEKIEYKGKDSERHYEIIEAATRAKIDQNSEVKKILLSTKDLILKPDHHEDKNAQKAWHYYEIYMKLRAELKTNGQDKKLLPEKWN